MRAKKNEILNALVAIINNKRDFDIAKNELWYRIPVDNAPKNIKNSQAKYIAFYFTKVFGKFAHKISYYSKIKSIEIANRAELFGSSEIKNADKKYYKINLESIQLLEQPIVSHRQRRIVFIETTLKKLMISDEINQLYRGTKIEEIMWKKLNQIGAQPEREYVVDANLKDINAFILDFAIFCKEKNIDVECNGFFHTKDAERVNYDKRRNNFLESKGWAVLRYPSEDIEYRIDTVVSQIAETVNRYGGVIVNENNDSIKLQMPDDTQINLGF